MMIRGLWKEVALAGCIAAAGMTWGTTPAARAAGDSAEVGIVSNIKVLSQNDKAGYKCEDVSSPETWKKTYIRDGMTDEQKALAVWKSVVKYRHQDHPPNEFISNMGNVHDPIKTFNVYGYGMCCCASSDIEGLSRYLGMVAQGRAISAHSVPEVWFDNSWHLLDASLMSYFRDASGKIASVDEIHQSIVDWRKDHPGEIKTEADAKKFSKNDGWKNGPTVLATVLTYDKDGINKAGWHGWWSNMFEYGKLPDKGVGIAPDGSKCVSVYDYGASMGYQVNVQLRAGESLTRNWSNKGLQVNMLEGDSPDCLNTRKPLGTFQKELGDMAPGRVGNGVEEYDVPLATGAFRRGALIADNLVSRSEGGPAGVAVKDPAKDGVLVERMPSSFVYLTGTVALSPVVGTGGSVTVLLSDNQGLDWKEIGKFDKSGDETIDIKKEVYRKYDYQIKIVMSGAGTGLNALKISDDFQHSQAVLPLLLEGPNVVHFSAGPQEGTITYEGNMDGKKDGKNLSYLDFHPVIHDLGESNLQVGGAGKGDATFTLKTPGDMTHIRMDAHYRCRDLTGKDAWTVEASFDQGQTWKPITTLDKAQPASSKYVTFDDVPANTHEAQVRFTGVQRNTTCLFDLRLDADYKEPAGGYRPVKVTYVWTEGGAEKKDQHVCKTADDTWTINCGPGTVAKSYTVELAK